MITSTFCLKYLRNIIMKEQKSQIDENVINVTK